MGRRIVAWAASQIGWPYVWGGDSEAEGGFDCSGLVDFAYANAGYALPGRPTAEVLLEMSQPISRAQLRPGDLVFLQTSVGYAFHVALYAGDGDVIVASHTGAPVAREPLSSVAWDSYGRIWTGGSLAPRPRAAVASEIALVDPVTPVVSQPVRAVPQKAAATATIPSSQVKVRAQVTQVAAETKPFRTPVHHPHLHLTVWGDPRSLRALR